MKNKTWEIPYDRRPVVPEELRKAGYPPLLAIVLALRGWTDPRQAAEMLVTFDETSPECLLHLHDPLKMKGMQDAVVRIHRAIDQGEAIAVYGDYDVDGITSTCIVTDYLRSCGASCTPYIPSRNDEGYGLNRDAVQKLHDRGITLIITVDCGITAQEEVDFAASLGMDVIITDHHECGSAPLPRAIAVVDCKQQGDDYENPNLAGCGVALKLVCACSGNPAGMLMRYSDLVAIGTVADVVPLVGENRFLVGCGLHQIKTNPRPGLAAMLAESGVDCGNITASNIGFRIAPRLNAAGRLGEAMVAAELLMAKGRARAAQLATDLCDLNRQRQSIEQEIWSDALKELKGKSPDSPIVLASEKWHQGVIGIAASRLAEHFSLPTIMINLNGDFGKGSCRSYGGFNLFQALSSCSEHLSGFGGHALAAGLSITRDRIDGFREALRQYYRDHEPEPTPDVLCDLLITEPELLSVENVRSLDRLEPYGNCNAKPLMCLSGVQLVNFSTVGSGHHLKMRVSLRGTLFDAMFFSHTPEEFGLKDGMLLDLAFAPQINEFRGMVNTQLNVSALRTHDPLEHCRAILENHADRLWCCAMFCPERADFIRVWRLIDRPGFRLPTSCESIAALAPVGMTAETFCVCLAVFLSGGLLVSETGKIYGAHTARIQGKMDLEAAELIRYLRCC